MNMRLGLTVLPLIAMAWSTPLAAEPHYAKVDRVLADAVIMPTYERYHQAMQDLAPAIRCKTPFRLAKAS